MSAVTFINCFAVPPEADDEFIALWQQVNAYMQAKPGYLSHLLHRALRPDARYRFVNTARWASEAAWTAAHDDGFRQLVNQPQWTPFPPLPALYEVVHEASAAASDAASGTGG